MRIPLPEPAPTPAFAVLHRRIVACRACPRLVEYLRAAKRKHPGFHCLPVPGFGDPDARLLVVGLAPGMRGANRTGRMFTGDASGAWLYRVLHETGFSTAPESVAAGDSLRLRDAFIGAAARCAPPQNRPTGVELDACRPFLAEEVRLLRRRRVTLALGRIAHDAALHIHGMRRSGCGFAHGAEHRLPDGTLLIDSYHCSRQNTNTRRLTWPMFLAVFRRAAAAVREGIDRDEADGSPDGAGRPPP